MFYRLYTSDQMYVVVHQFITTIYSFGEPNDFLLVLALQVCKYTKIFTKMSWKLLVFRKYHITLIISWQDVQNGSPPNIIYY